MFADAGEQLRACWAAEEEAEARRVADEGGLCESELGREVVGAGVFSGCFVEVCEDKSSGVACENGTVVVVAGALSGCVVCDDDLGDEDDEAAGEREKDLGEEGSDDEGEKEELFLFLFLSADGDAEPGVLVVSGLGLILLFLLLLLL